MNILCDKPSVLKEALGGNISVGYSPALDIYTPDNMFLRTLKGMYCSSKLDLEDEMILSYIREIAEPANLPEPCCHTCYNYEDFDSFCKEYIDNCDEQLRVAYDVETTAAPFLSEKYKLVGFSLATCVSDGCYVILNSIDYDNPDTDKILERLSDIIKNHSILVFNAQHEYIASKRCLDVDIRKDSKHLDDAYSMALLLKTESFRPDVFKLKLLCHRLLGLENWATILDDYIELALMIGRSDVIDFNNITDDQKEMIVAYRDMLKTYGYTNKEIISFIIKIQESYKDWSDQDTIPYSLIPSKMISIYGCYDSCYLLALMEYFDGWVKELTAKLDDSLNKPNIPLAYEETIDGQIMSGILTLNGIFISEERDNEVKQKSRALAEERYNKLWEINSDSLGVNILREFSKIKHKDVLEKKYLLPFCLTDLIPDGWKFIKTTPTFYSFECEALTEDALNWAIDEEGLKSCDKTGTHFKLLQKHLKPFNSLDNEEELLDNVLDKFLQDNIEKDGTLAKNVFKPMSGPKELYDILNKDFEYSYFMDRVVLYEYNNLPEKLKNSKITSFLDEHWLYNFDNNPELYVKAARLISNTVLDYIKKSYSYKEIYEKLLQNGIKSFSSPIIAYIYNIYTATGCSVDNPKHSVFNFICQLKIYRKYARIDSTFIKGSSGGYASQMQVYNDSIKDEFLRLKSTSVVDENGEPIYTEDTSNVVFGSWYASTADTGRWQATIHNVPAGEYCKRRFVSRFPGGIILAADMSQMEVRELAMLSKSEKLIETIKDPTIDIHKRTASLAFDIPYDEVKSTQRKQTKEGIFSIVYGRELESLAQNLFKGDKAAAQRLMDAIFKVFPEVPIYLKNALEDAKKHGYLVTRRGAPIYINPYTNDGNSKGEQAFKRNVQNYAIQGGASYICTCTLTNVQKLIDKYGMNDKIKVICYIHDSIELDVAPDAIDIAYKILYTAFCIMPNKLYNVPTTGDVVIGISMGEELEMNRIEENHYKISGYAPYIEDLIKHLSNNYDVEIVDKQVSDTVEVDENLDWCFTPRAPLVWRKESQDGEYEIILKK